MKSLTTEFIFNNNLSKYYNKFKETKKAICFTLDSKGTRQSCSCRMVGCGCKTIPYTKRYYYWIPKSVLKVGMVNDFRIKTKSNIEDKVTLYNIKIPLKYLKTNFSHYVKKA